MTTPQTWERDSYDFSGSREFSNTTGYRRTVRRTVTPTPRGTIELTQQEFEGLMKLAGYTPVEP